MNKLKDKEILIGREPERGRLLVAMDVKGQMKLGAIGEIGSVPVGVSRCRPDEGTAHCIIKIDSEGALTLSNGNSKNATHVNGVSIETKTITCDSKISLGNESYSVDVNAIIEVAKRLLNDGGYSINHLNEVWETFDGELYELQKRQKSLALVKSLYMPCTVLSTMAGFAFKQLGLSEGTTETVSFIMYLVAAVVLFYGLYRTYADHSLEERKQIEQKCQDEYVCPHCKHFLGFQAYRILRQNKNCPYCKCKWVEDKTDREE